jgi:hypothetical protein
MRSRIIGQLAALGAALTYFINAPSFAQTDGQIVDVVTVTPATEGYVHGSLTGYFPTNSLGHVSPTTTIEGVPYANVYAQVGPGVSWFVFSLGNLTSDPGQADLYSLTCAGNATWYGSAAGYTYSSGTASWRWSTTGSGGAAGFQASQTAPVSCTVVRTGTSGWIRPKYQVVGLTYAPPGAKSSATYTNGFDSGTSTTNSSSWKVSASVKDTFSGGADLFGVLSGSTNESYSANWSQQSDASNTISIDYKETTGLTVPGPSSSGVGVDHDFDTIYVWLNPMVFMETFTNLVDFAAYGYDARDTVTGMDVIPLTVGQLKGTQTIPSNTLARLARSWDSSLGALSTADYQAILHADPFVANPAFNPNTDTSGRYELPISGSPAEPTDLIFNYVPAPAGEQPTSQTYTSTYTSTSAKGQGATDTYSVSYSLDGSVSAAFIASVQSKLTVSTSYSYTNKWSQTITNSTSQAANFTIVPPAASDNYTGLTAIQVWKDNVYGTFMFYPE